MNRIIIVLAAALMAAQAFFATAADNGGRLKIVATSFPHYDWARQVLGERLAATDLVLLQQSGVDLHSYTPSAADLREIAACGLFIHVGGESDGWAGRALAQPGNPRRRVLNLVKALGPAAKAEKTTEGMEHHHHHHHHGGHHDADHDHDGHEEHHDADHDHDGHDKHHDADDDHDHEHGEAPEIDEHVWLSLRHAATLTRAIAAELAALDPENADAYRANAEAYCEKLAALDHAYAAAVAGAKRKVLLVADRFPFRYLADDYGLEYFAAFSGCSAESEASFKTIAFLAKKVDELGLPVILTIEGPTHKIAETVQRTTKAHDQRIMSLDSLQSTTGEAAKTARYLDAMAKNLETLKVALN